MTTARSPSHREKENGANGDSIESKIELCRSSSRASRVALMSMCPASIVTASRRSSRRAQYERTRSEVGVARSSAWFQSSSPGARLSSCSSNVKPRSSEAR